MKKTLLFKLLLWSVSMALFAQTDTVPPQITCKTSIEKYVQPTCLLTVIPDELIESVSDNTTPLSSLVLGLRRQCMGVGFPENALSLTLGLGTESPVVEVWAKDQSGNVAMCTMHVNIIIHLGSCESWTYHSVIAETPQEALLYQYKTHAQGNNCLMESFDLTDSTLHNYTSININTPDLAGYDFFVEPSKTVNPKNGVDNNDIQLIYNYFAGTDTLSPWQLIAADANQDGKVTIFDVVVIRKLLLGLTDEFPSGKSWRFVPYNYVFPNPANPFQPPFPERTVFGPSIPSYLNESHFIAVKIGDVNGSADPKN